MNYPNALSSVTGSVNALPHCFPGRPRIVAFYYGTTMCFSKPSSRGCAPVPLDGTCPLVLTNGTVSSAASNGGQTAGCLSGCSRPSAAIPIPQDMCPSAAPLSRFTRRPLAQKGDSAPVHWLIPQRADHKDHGLVDGLGSLIGFLLLRRQTHARRE